MTLANGLINKHDQHFRCIAYGNGQFLALGEEGIAASVNGLDGVVSILSVNILFKGTTHLSGRQIPARHSYVAHNTRRVAIDNDLDDGLWHRRTRLEWE